MYQTCTKTAQRKKLEEKFVSENKGTDGGGAGLQTRVRWYTLFALVGSGTTDMVRATALGKLCKRRHDHEGTGLSMRYIHKRRGTPTGNCVACGRENGAKDRGGQNEDRERLARSQGRTDGKYIGAPCADGHVERYVIDGSCVVCETARRRDRAQDPERRPVEKARKTRDNVTRALYEFDEEFHPERQRIFELESRRRSLLKLTNGNR